MSSPFDPSSKLHKALGSLSDFALTKQLSVLSTSVAVAEALSPLPGVAEKLKELDSNRRLVESMSKSFVPILPGFAADVLRSQNAVSHLLESLFGSGSVLQELAKSAKLATERYERMFGPTSELAKTLSFSRLRLDEFSGGHIPDIDRSAAQMSRMLGDLGSQASTISRDLFASPAMRATQEMIRSLTIAHPSIAGPDRATLASFRRLNITGLDALSDRMRAITDSLPELDMSEANGEEAELSDAELVAVRETGDAIASIVEARFDALDARIDRTNAAIQRIEELMRRSKRSIILLFVLHSIWSLLLNVAASYVCEFLQASNQAVRATPSVSTRPADVMREARRSVSLIDVPPEIIREFRVVKRQSLAVFGGRNDGLGPVAQLSIGTVVEIKAAAGKWRYIRWVADDSTAPTEGWVRAKYLGKLTP